MFLMYMCCFVLYACVWCADLLTDAVIYGKWTYFVDIFVAKCAAKTTVKHVKYKVYDTYLPQNAEQRIYFTIDKHFTC